jgi:hypothetical protein
MKGRNEMSDFSAPAKRQLEAYNNRDIDAFMSCYSSDCVVEDAEGNILMTNAEQMRERYSKLFNGNPNLHCKLVSRIVVGNYVMDEENVAGKEGSQEITHVVAIYRIAEGLITHVRFIR